jgi:2-oxo-3-hexenedioate decarboxylase/2-keto-4-pentenoate hydratase
MAAPEQAAELLAAARLAVRPVQALPAECRPADETAGYAAQFALARRLAAAGRGARVGWKIACTTKVMQDLLGIPTPCAGGVLAKNLFRGRAEFAAGGLIRPGIECEIAVRLVADVPPAVSHTADSIRPVVTSIAAAMEVVDDRYQDFRGLGAPTLIADDFFQAALVLGEERTDWRDFDLSGAIGRTYIDGRPTGEGRGADVMGHPLAALAWLANRLAALGQPLKAGEVVSTGSLVKVEWLSGPCLAETEIVGLGRVAARFS